MSHVKTLEAAMNRVPANAFFIVSAKLRDDNSEDGALWLEVLTTNRRDCVRVRHSDGDGVCLGLVGFERSLLSLQEKVVERLETLGYDIEKRELDPSAVFAYDGVSLARGRKKPTATNWDF